MKWIGIAIAQVQWKQLCFNNLTIVLKWNYLGQQMFLNCNSLADCCVGSESICWCLGGSHTTATLWEPEKSQSCFYLGDGRMPWAVCISTLLTSCGTGKYIFQVPQEYLHFTWEKTIERLKGYEFTLPMRHSEGCLYKVVFPLLSAHLLPYSCWNFEGGLEWDEL